MKTYKMLQWMNKENKEWLNANAPNAYFFDVAFNGHLRYNEYREFFGWAERMQWPSKISVLHFFKSEDMTMFCLSGCARAIDASDFRTLDFLHS